MKSHYKIIGLVLLANTMMFACISFAQNPPTSPVQEALDFLNSPEGTNVNRKVHVLMSASFGKIGISNELTRVSADISIALPVRQFAQEALLTYDSSATNTYEEVVAFVTAWPFTEVAPPLMTTNTIIVMKRGLEIGSSGFVHLENMLNNTNYPALYRAQMGQLVTNGVNQIISNK